VQQVPTHFYAHEKNNFAEMSKNLDGYKKFYLTSFTENNFIGPSK